MGLLLLHKAVQDNYKDETYQVSPPDAALTRLLNILQRGLLQPSLPSTDLPACILSTLPTFTGPPEVTTIADPYHSGLTNRVTHSGSGSQNLCPVSTHDTVQQKGGMHNNQN